MAPTQEQLDSRKKLDQFIEAMRPIREWGRGLSKWFSRPDDELKGWMERGRAIAEIEDSLGYRLITEQIHKEIMWAQNELEREDVAGLREYLKALRFVEDFILTTKRNADISSRVLAGRADAIGRDSFVKNARVEG